MESLIDDLYVDNIILRKNKAEHFPPIFECIEGVAIVDCYADVIPMSLQVEIIAVILCHVTSGHRLENLFKYPVMNDLNISRHISPS